MICVDALDFSEWHSEKVRSFFDAQCIMSAERSIMLAGNAQITLQQNYATVDTHYKEHWYNKILI